MEARSRAQRGRTRLGDSVRDWREVRRVLLIATTRRRHLYLQDESIVPGRAICSDCACILWRIRIRGRYEQSS